MTTMFATSTSNNTVSPADWLRRTTAAIRVAFTWWGVHRTLTAQQKEEVGLTYNADSRFVTAGKKLVDVRHEAFRKLTSLRSRIIHYWRGLTLPYVEPGIRLIRQSDVDTFVRVMQDFHRELLEAEHGLNLVYDQVKIDARERLGRLYNPADYPPEIRGLFNVEWDFPSIEPPNYLSRLSPELYRQEQERVAHRFEEAVQLAEQAFIGEFSKLVSHLTERLSGSDDNERKIFRDSAIHNLVDFFDRFRNLSVRSNEQLDRLVQQAQDLIRGVQPQSLRDNDSLRQQFATQMSGVQSVLDGMMIDRPRRRIIRNSTENPT